MGQVNTSVAYNKSPGCLTLDQLITRLQNIRNKFPGDYHIHLCTEHASLGGTQLQEPIKDIAVSKGQGCVILLAKSFK